MQSEEGKPEQATVPEMAMSSEASDRFSEVVEGGKKEKQLPDTWVDPPVGRLIDLKMQEPEPEDPSLSESSMQWAPDPNHASTPRECSPVDSRLVTGDATDGLEPPILETTRYLLADEADGLPPPTWAEQVEREILEEEERQRQTKGVRKVRVADRVYWNRYAWYDPTTPVEDDAISPPREGDLASTELRRPRTLADLATYCESAAQRENRAAQEELQAYLSEAAGDHNLSATDQADMELLEELAPVEEMVEANSEVGGISVRDDEVDTFPVQQARGPLEALCGTLCLLQELRGVPAETHETILRSIYRPHRR